MENTHISEFSNNLFLVDDDFVSKINHIQVKNIQVRPEWYTNLGQFYNDYIQPNLFALVAFIILSIFLIFRYFIKKDRRRKKIKKNLKKVLDYEHTTSEGRTRLTEKEEDEYLDKYIDELIKNEEANGLEDDDDTKNTENVSEIDKALKYYHDLEKSGLASSQYINQEKDNELKKLNFNHLAKLVTGAE